MDYKAIGEVLEVRVRHRVVLGVLIVHALWDHTRRELTSYKYILENGKAIITTIDWHSMTCMNVLAVVFETEP